MNEIIKELEKLTEQGKWDEAKEKIEDVKKSDLPPTEKGEIYTKFALMYARQKTEASQPYKEALADTIATLKQDEEAEQKQQTDATSPPETTTESTPEHQAPQKTETNNHADPQTTEAEKKEPPPKKEVRTPNHKAKLIAGWTLLLVSVTCIATGSVLISIVEKLGRAGKHYQHALVLYEKNDSHEGARRELLEVIRLNPEHFEAHKMLGGMYADIDRFADSARAYDKAYFINPFDIDVLFGLGDANTKASEKYGKKDYDMRAIKAYKKITALNPNSARAQYSLAIVYQKLEMYMTALTLYEKYIALEERGRTSRYGAESDTGNP